MSGGDHLPPLEMLRLQREAYQELVRAYLFPDYKDDMAISAEGMRFVLEQVAARATEERPARVLDLGMGFSTLVLGSYRRARILSIDHDPGWMRFMRVALGAMVGNGVWEASRSEPPRLTMLLRDAAAPSPPAYPDGPFDVILVDHNDGANAALVRRAADVPLLVPRLAPDGVLLFDDWRPKHEGRIRRALAAVGGDWKIGGAEHTRRWPRDKAIGWAHR